MGEQLAAQRTAGVRAGKVFGAEAPGVQQGHSQRVAHGQLGRGAGGGGQVERAGFARHAAVEHQVGITREGGLQTARHGDHGRAQTPQHGQDGREFAAFAAVGDGQHQVVAGDHAQVAMAGFGGMDKKRGGAGGGQRGGDLAAHMAAFAHAHHYHTAPGLQHHLHRLGKHTIHAGRQAVQGFHLNVEGLAGQAQGLISVKRGQRGGGGSHAWILSTGHAGRAVQPPKSTGTVRASSPQSLHPAHPAARPARTATQRRPAAPAHGLLESCVTQRKPRIASNPCLLLPSHCFTCWPRCWAW